MKRATKRPRSLDRLERWVQEVITHPKGPTQGAKSASALRLLPKTRGRIDAVVTASATLEADDRINIYASMYWLRLVDCLSEDYPGLKAALGDATFERLLRRFLQAHPSTHPNLNQLSQPLPKYLAAHPITSKNQKFLAELATLERTLQDVFDAEHAEPLDAASLRRIRPEEFGRARFEFVPCFRLRAFEYPVNRWFQSFRDGKRLALPRREPSFVAICRRDFRVWRADLDLERFLLLQALLEGATLEEALIQSTARSKLGLDRMATSVGVWFQGFAENGFFASIATKNRGR